MSVLRDMMRFRPLDEGELVPPLSLTADEGTWIKIRDFQDHLNIVLVFFKDESSETEAYLKSLDQARTSFDELEAVVFAVNTAPTDRLRDLRAHLRVGFYFLYDPLALTARAFGASGRLRPQCRDAVYLIGKDGRVLHAARGFTEARVLLDSLARLQGRDLPVAAKDGHADAAGSSFTRDPGKKAARAVDIESPQAEEMLTAEDSDYKLVDVRTKSEFDADHSVHAIHIPVDELPHRYHDLGQSDRLIFVCQGGDRSAAAAEFMTSIGASSIYNVLGGMSSWMGPRTATPVEDQ
jgi:rhodanese-related sulfurtransferase/peroxiredoxin